MAGIAATPGYCAICGREADSRVHRLGEVFCSEAHAAEFAHEVQSLTAVHRNQDTHEGRI